MDSQALPARLEGEKRKEPEEEGERKEELAVKAIKESWDVLGKAASKALWALLESKEKQESKERWEATGPKACRGLKESLENLYQPLISSFL